MTPVAEDERQQTEAWVVEQFERLGFDADDALLLALAGADWHRAEVMLSAGCDRATCLWILV